MSVRLEEPSHVLAFPESVNFKYPWRKYQQRVLDELPHYLSDGHLHIIAPPGSGKTVLGLEVAVRINKPTLILTPSIAIRNQWVQRFCTLFLQTEQVPDWISSDIRTPEFLTVVTYQALHAACNNLNPEEEEKEQDSETLDADNARSANANLDKIVAGLRAQSIKTIVVDEAHHLKNEWWLTLNKVKEYLDPVIVGLTATPPYDVTVAEWQRYLDLCGSVDAEISVPELVAEGDLCPHQDYVHFTLPTPQETEDIVAFRENIEKLFHEVRTDIVLVSAIESHPAWTDPAGNLDWIYTNISFYSASLIFLNANGRMISEAHLEVIGDKKTDIPALDYSWMEKLLEFYLYKENEGFKRFSEHRKQLENRLKKSGAIERRQISFTNCEKISGSLTSSISKLNSIKEIADFEYGKLGQDLRMVILTDYIRKEFLFSTPDNGPDLNKLGVVPIFEKLRRENGQNKKIGVLTGSLVIIPISAWSAFESKAAAYGAVNVSSSPAPFDPGYLIINPAEQLKNDIVRIITEIFQHGDIEVLIGTKSLLGEGWDAPAINSLVLASFVGSFVLSNQMRGRAIRTQRGNNTKTGNIWHLVCIDPTSPNGGNDLELLQRRFKSFVGVSCGNKPGIENGIGRLDIPYNINDKGVLDQKNQATFNWAGNRESLKDQWKAALENGVNLVEEIRVPFDNKRDYKTNKSLYYNRTIVYLLGMLWSGLASFAYTILQSLGRSHISIRSAEEICFFLSIIGFTGVLLFGRLAYKAISLYFSYRDISKDIGQIAEALLNALKEAGIISTDISNLKVVASVDNEGAVSCRLDGGATFERSAFINALQELIGPVANPRYVIVRKSRFMFLIKQKDYHPLPDVIGKNKNLAEYFKRQWESFVGDCDLIFTRSLDGRRRLLESRVKSLAAQFENQVERVNKWR